MHTYLDSLTSRQRGELGGVRDRLAIMAESDVGSWLDPATPGAESFELLDAVRSGAVVYFSLHADTRPLLAQMLGAAIVQDLQTVVAALQEHPARCVVAIDEFSAIAAEHVAGLFARARSAGISLLLGTQELSDLRLPGRETLQEQVLGNLTSLIAHRQVVPASAELIARLAGSRGAWRTSVSSDGRSTRTRVSEPLISPEEVMGLATGQAAVLRLSSPRSAAVARMHSPDRDKLNTTTQGGPTMVSESTHHDNSSPERRAIVRWAAGMGAVTAEAVAVHLGVSPASARGRLRAAEGERLLTRCRPLTGQPALYTVTRAGLRKADVGALDPCTVSPSNALHLIECARVAAALQRCYSDHRVQGERELRVEERECGCALASAELYPAGACRRTRNGRARREALPPPRPRAVAAGPGRWPAGGGGGGADRQGARAPGGDLPGVGADALRGGRALPRAARGASVRSCGRSTARRLMSGWWWSPSTRCRSGSRGRASVPSQAARKFSTGQWLTAKGDEVMSYTSINRVVLVGNLTRDPELRELPSGSSVCNLRIACNGIAARR